MDEILTRMWENLGGRLQGPMHFRFFLQPLMAAIFAIRDGIQDARTGRPAFFWSLFTDPNRMERIRSGWKSVSRVFLMAVAMDIVYQLIELRWIYPGETLVVAFALAIVPYLLLRGPVKRLAQHWVGKSRGVAARPTQ